MDKEQKVAYEIIRQRIVNEIDRLESLGKEASASTLKKWRRYGAAFSWDPTVYPALLENPTVPDKKLLQLLRGTEEKFMKKWQAVEGIPLHHVIANRTGGDLGLRLPVDVWEEVKQRVFDATGARPGNSQANLNAASQFDERSHLGRYGAKGTVFDPVRGLGEAPDPTQSPILHGPGTKDFGTRLGKNPVILQSTPAQITEALLPEVTKQQDIYKTVTESPTTQAQRQVFTEAGLGAAFDPSTPIEQMPEIKARALELRLPEQFAGAWQVQPRFNGGKAILRALPLGAVATAAFTAADVAQAAQGISSVQQATSTPEAVAGGLEAASGALGVAATKVPVLTAPAAVLGITGGAIRMRMQRDIEREQVQQVMAGERSEYGPSVTETPTLTRTLSNYERNIQARMKARRGR
jgi:hypothetical protein